MRNAWIIAKKELYELRKNKQLLYTIVFMPVFFSILLPFSMIGVFVGEEINETDSPFPVPDGVDAKQFIIMQFIGSTLLMFMILPAMIPSVMASYTIAGEKLSKSLEPLLATPASDSEILTGKTLSTMIPAVALSWIALVIFVAITDYLVMPVFGYLVLPNAEWLFTAFVMTPLMAWISINFSIIVSSKVTDIRTAQQVSGIIVIPIIAFMMATLFGVIMVTLVNLAMISLVLLLFNLVLFKISRSLFQRESILVKWK